MTVADERRFARRSFGDGFARFRKEQMGGQIGERDVGANLPRFVKEWFSQRTVAEAFAKWLVGGGRLRRNRGRANLGGGARCVAC